MARFPALPALPPRKSALVPLFAALLVTGCAAPGQFPSLARRPLEDVPGRITGSALLASPTPQTAPAPASATGDNDRLGELRSAAHAAHSRFADKRDRAEALTGAARDAAPGSEAWASATVALAELTADHDMLVEILADIDAIDIRQRVDGGDGGAIAAVRDQVTAWVADENAVLAELGKRLRN